MRTPFLAVLAGALLVVPNAFALWPHPADYSAATKKSFVQVSPKLEIKLSAKTDASRVPQDLTRAISDAQSSIASQPLWALVPDRGDSYRSAVNAAPTLSSVELTVVELLSSAANTCVSSTRARSRQKLFSHHALAATASPDDADAAWSNKCSISSRAIQQLNLTTTTKPFKTSLATATTMPSSLSVLDSEAYQITVPSDGSAAQIKAYTALGAFRGLTTLKQLVYALPPSSDGGKGMTAYIKNVPITINDKPAFPYRGLLLDTSRNWYPVQELEKLLDGMSHVKMNQFHWHATDTQSWPLAFTGDADLEQLAQTGSYGWTNVNGTFVRAVYTEDDIKNVVNYAGARGINVIVEIDMPSHLLSGVVSLQNGKLITCPANTDWQNAGAEPPTGQFNLLPTKNAQGVPSDIASLVGKLLTKVADLSRSPYVSSGGDEPNLKCWGVAKETDIDTSVIKPFMQLVGKTTSAANKLGMVWEEMATKFPATAKVLKAGSIVEVWNDAMNAATVLDNNPDVNVVLAPYESFYLDCGGASWLGNTTIANWCPYVGWQKQYAFVAESIVDKVLIKLKGKSSAAVAQRMIGGESAVWSEQTDATNLQSRVWPRAAAGAEVFWTGDTFTKNSQSVTRNSNEALARILDLTYRLKTLGINSEPLQPLWCALRPGKCNLY